MTVAIEYKLRLSLVLEHLAPLWGPRRTQGAPGCECSHHPACSRGIFMRGQVEKQMPATSLTQLAPVFSHESHVIQPPPPPAGALCFKFTAINSYVGKDCGGKDQGLAAPDCGVVTQYVIGRQVEKCTDDGLKHGTQIGVNQVWGGKLLSGDDIFACVTKDHEAIDGPGDKDLLKCAETYYNSNTKENRGRKHAKKITLGLHHSSPQGRDVPAAHPAAPAALYVPASHAVQRA